MKKHFTSRYISYLIIISVCLFAAAVLSRIEITLISLPFLSAIVVSLFLDKTPCIVVSHCITGQRLFEGDDLNVSIKVQALTNTPLVELLDPLPHGAQLKRGNNDIVTSLRKGEEKVFNYSFSVPARSRFTLGGMIIRIHNSSGLIYREMKHKDIKDFAVYPKAPSFREDIRPFHTQVNVGNYVSRVMGEGIEFGDLRQYIPGDSIKKINWKASARTGLLHVNEYARERNSDIVLMVDSFRNFGPAGNSYLDLAARTAGALAFRFLSGKNRVGFIEFGGRFIWLLPGLGTRQWYRILEDLTDMEVKERYATQDITAVPPRILPPQALVIAITPFLDSRFKEAVLDLFNRGFDTVTLSLSPSELIRRIVADNPVNRAAMDIWEMEKENELMSLRKIGLPILRWDPEEPLDLLARSIRALQHRRAS